MSRQVSHMEDKAMKILGFNVLKDIYLEFK